MLAQRCTLLSKWDAHGSINFVVNFADQRSLRSSLKSSKLLYDNSLPNMINASIQSITLLCNSFIPYFKISCLPETNSFINGSEQLMDAINFLFSTAQESMFILIVWMFVIRVRCSLLGLQNYEMQY
uniref:Uncharacterized protein n=1 Tax=Glossina pallidipes TaxID=7398 RepID=A0A1A9ZIM1_GLOPL